VAFTDVKINRADKLSQGLDKLSRMWIYIFKLMRLVFGILRISVQRMSP